MKGTPEPFRAAQGNPLFLLLHQLHLSPDRVGFWYILSAIGLAHQDMEAMTCLTKHLYAVIADMYGVSPSAVESGLRHAVSACWQGSRPLLEEIMGRPLPKRPAVGRFLAALLVWEKTAACCERTGTKEAS